MPSGAFHISSEAFWDTTTIQYIRAQLVGKLLCLVCLNTYLCWNPTFGCFTVYWKSNDENKTGTYQWVCTKYIGTQNGVRFNGFYGQFALCYWFMKVLQNHGMPEKLGRKINLTFQSALCPPDGLASLGAGIYTGRVPNLSPLYIWVCHFS